MYKLIISCVAILLLSVIPAMSQGIYIGAGIGNSSYSLELEESLEEAKDISENSTAYKFFGGYRGESIIGLEGGYRNFGEIEGKVVDQGVTSKTTGWDVEALGRIEIAIIDIFAKAGALFWKTETTVEGFEDFSGEESGTAFMWGLGAGVHLGALGIRLEYENFQVETPDNLYMLSLSATFGF
jgi:hypothetical protein